MPGLDFRSDGFGAGSPIGLKAFGGYLRFAGFGSVREWRGLNLCRLLPDLVSQASLGFARSVPVGRSRLVGFSGPVRPILVWLPM